MYANDDDDEMAKAAFPDVRERSLGAARAVGAPWPGRPPALLPPTC